MNISEKLEFFKTIGQLASSGFKPSDIKGLIEAIETSPEVQKVEAGLDEKGDVEIKKTEKKTEADEGKEKKEEPNTPPSADGIAELVKLLKED